MSRVWTLADRGDGETLDLDRIFALFEAEDPALGEGQVRVRNTWLSVDPYMRGLLDGKGGYMPALPLGAPMEGGAVGEVVESRAPALPVGTTVSHNAGWRDMAVLDAAACDPFEAKGVPEQNFLGAFGMPGATAYFGLLHAGRAKAGETLFVSSAGGAVGSTVVQIAKAVGLTVIGSAGGAERCAAIGALGADATIDYRTPGTMSEKLREAVPEGIDFYFDNVAGDHLAAAIDNSRLHMRAVLCGMISGYGSDAMLQIAEPMRLIMRRISLIGYFAPDFYPMRGQFLEDMHRWYDEGKLSLPSRVHEGLEVVPEAFGALFVGGGDIGKTYIRLG